VKLSGRGGERGGERRNEGLGEEQEGEEVEEQVTERVDNEEDDVLNRWGERSGGCRDPNNWNFDPFWLDSYPPLGPHNSSNNNVDILSMSTSEDANKRVSTHGQSTDEGAFPNTSQETARDRRRLSGIPVPDRSPMKTRNRTRAASVNRPAEKDSVQTNTLQNWVRQNNAKSNQQESRGGGGQYGPRAPMRGVGRGGRGNGAGGGGGGGRGGGGMGGGENGQRQR